MSYATDFSGGKPTNNNLTILAEMVIRIPLKPAAVPTMAEDIPNLQIGDFALLKEDNPSPLRCPIVVITNIHPHQMASYSWSHLGTPRELHQTSHSKNLTLTTCE
jgi:hypothetical protein